MRPPWWRTRRRALLAALAGRDCAYVYDLATVESQARLLLGMRSIARVLYAIKANPHPEILRAVAALGCGFECVSRGEIERVLESVPAIERERILFTPNFAPRAEYRWALEQGLKVTVDNLFVLKSWPELFSGHDIFLRLDPGQGHGHHEKVRTGGLQSKFGVPPEEFEEVPQAVSAAGARVVGLHAHGGSGSFDLEGWLGPARVLAENAVRFPEARILNLGGGLGVPDGMHREPVDLAGLDQGLAAFQARHPGFGLWLEPGRFLVAAAGVLLARVTQTKGKGSKRYVGIATGMNSLIRPALYGAWHEIVNLSRLDEPATMTCTIVGSDLRERGRARDRPPVAGLRRGRRAPDRGRGRLRSFDVVALQPEAACAGDPGSRVTEVHRSHLWQLVLINAIWGFNIVAVKLSADRFPPVFLSFLRFLIVGIIVWPWLRIRRGEMRWLLTAATCSGGLQFALMYSGVALSGNMSSVSIAGQLGVPFATLLSVLLLGERIHWRRWLGIGMAFVGVVLIGLSPDVFTSWPGLILIVIASFIGAVGLIAIKRVHALEPLELQAWLAWGSLPLLLPLSLLLEDGQLESLRHAGATGWGALLYSALLASLVAHTGYFALIRRYPVTSVAPVTVLTPLFGVLFSVLLLGDVLDWRLITGGLLTLSGITVIVVREKKAAATGT